SLEHYIIPITLGIIVALFAAQSHGTGRVAALFGPIMVVWFLTLGVLGLTHIGDSPDILLALNPWHGVKFIFSHGLVGFVVMGSVFLAVTGAEALYADMGHFGKKPIRIAWIGFVLPCLLLNYYGQGALMLKYPDAIENPFFRLAPDWAGVPLLLLATVATVIASQAVITGAFSLARQAIQLGLLPRLEIQHTSDAHSGQIYIPRVNMMLLVGVMALVVMFRTSSALASAYGIAVTIDMTITTIMTFFVVRYAWRLPLAFGLAATGLFFVVDFSFFAANAVKLFEGGWFPVAIGGALFTLMLTWKQGRRLMRERLRSESIDLASFLEAIFVSPPQRVAGTAVFLHSERGSTPFALLHNLKHNKVLHEQNLFVTVMQHEVPWIGFDKRIEIEPLGHDCWQVTLHFGFKNEPDVPEALALLAGRGVKLDAMETSYFLSRDTVVPTFGGGMAMWREKLFASMHRNAAAAADFLHLPTNRIVELGTKLEI
ncbi:MAG: potassium transporter Kup, partial [Comamonadaceae bacterium]|nr:potassium transporter Kup [Comamonadaceae bacterium]